MHKIYLFLALMITLVFMPFFAAGKFPVVDQNVKKMVRPALSSSHRENAGYQQWFVSSADQPWAEEEIAMVQDILAVVIEALAEQGLDGEGLLRGYRFRRQYGEYVTGYPGRIAVVNHQSQEITLADAAFKRLHGFYIIHELGHIVDRRTERQLTAIFHSLAGSDLTGRNTAPGFWLNLHAEHDLEEATADAFALWIMSIYDSGYRPVFAYTPVASDYDGIASTFVTSIDTLVQAQ